MLGDGSTASATQLQELVGELSAGRTAQRPTEPHRPTEHGGAPEAPPAIVAAMQPERFAVGLTPLPTAARVTQRRAALRWRIITTVISLAILAAILLTIGRDWSREMTTAVVALWVASSGCWLVVSIVGLQRAKRDLGRIHDGVAFYIDPHGVEFVDPPHPLVPWFEVTALQLVGRSRGAGPRIALDAAGRRIVGVPISFLDATPAVIDSAARAYSLGRVHLDVSALDRLL